jgi:predicted GNAT superfamily acetyltransferase
MIDIRIASTIEELTAIYKFRYAISVNEMKWRESYANHEKCVIMDALDSPKAMVLGAWKDKELIGLSRSNFIRDGGIGDYLKYYNLIHLPEQELSKASITTLLMVHPTYRYSILTSRLVCETYRHGLEQGIETNYCDCDPYLLSFYTKLGYLVIDKNFIHPEFGLGSVMKLNMYDLEHLEHLRSPFRKVLKAHLSKRCEKVGD